MKTLWIILGSLATWVFLLWAVLLCFKAVSEDWEEYEQKKEDANG